MKLDLKFVTSEKDLIGQEISYCNFIEGYEEGYNIIATKDKYIRITEQFATVYDGIYVDEPMTTQQEFDKMLLKHHLVAIILINYKVIPEEYYKELLEEEKRKEQETIEQRNQKQKEKEYQEFLKLKAKFEK